MWWWAACVAPPTIAPADPAHDWDRDGFTENAGDCDDGDASVHPNAVEICGDGRSQRCADDPPCALSGELSLADGTLLFPGCRVGPAGDVNGDGIPEVVVGDYFGGGAVIDPSTGWILRLDGATNGPTAVARAGDLDGDGAGEVSIGLATRGEDVTGAAWVVAGRTAPGTDALATASSVTRVFGPARLGYAVAGGEDVDGDGVADVWFGAPTFDDAPDAGEVFGRSGAPTEGEDLGEAPMGVTGGAGVGFGAALALADVDGDGLSDVLIGAEGGAAGPAAISLLSGGVPGIADAADLPAWTGSVSAAGGLSVVAGGDLDGDGRPELLFGLPLEDADAGAVVVVQGGEEPAPLAGAWARWIGPAGARLGSALASAGDVDGDGVADVLAGAPLGVDGARAYLVSDVAAGVAPIVGLATAVIVGAGDAVGAAGDVDHDGYADIAVSSCDPLGTSSAVLLLGGPVAP